MRINPTRTADLLAPTNSQPLKLSTKGLPVLMNALSSFYQDPHAAAIRETVSNAIDAHTAAGTTAPVRVTMPDAYTTGCELTITDDGTGMDHDTLVNTFGAFGESTKTDDNTSLGRWGLGAKSPMSIADSMTVESVTNGLLNVAYFSIHPTNGIMVGYLIENEPTESDNGTRVRIPIRDEYTHKRLSDTLKPQVQFFPTGSITINDEPVLCILDDAVWVDPYTAALPVEYTHLARTYAAMGGVCYDTNVANLTAPRTKWSIYYVAPIGAITPNSNRESLLPETNTREFLTRAHVDIEERLDTALDRHTDTFNTPREAIAWAVKRTSQRSITWRGQHYDSRIDLPRMELDTDRYGHVHKTPRAVATDFTDASRMPQIILTGEAPAKAAVAAYLNAHGLSCMTIVPTPAGSNGWLTWGDGSIPTIGRDDFDEWTRANRPSRQPRSDPASYTIHTHDGERSHTISEVREHVESGDIARLLVVSKTNYVNPDMLDEHTWVVEGTDADVARWAKRTGLNVSRYLDVLNDLRRAWLESVCDIDNLITYMSERTRKGRCLNPEYAELLDTPELVTALVVIPSDDRFTFEMTHAAQTLGLAGHDLLPAHPMPDLVRWVASRFDSRYSSDDNDRRMHAAAINAAYAQTRPTTTP